MEFELSHINGMNQVTQVRQADDISTSRLVEPPALLFTGESVANMNDFSNEFAVFT